MKDDGYYENLVPVLSQCPKCYCMTKIIDGKCGKCGKPKSI